MKNRSVFGITYLMVALVACIAAAYAQQSYAVLPEIKQRVQVYCQRGNSAHSLSELQATLLLP